MDGPQDLGGKEAFGPVETDSPLFRHEWERRQWALSKTMRVPPGTIDWFRHCIEVLPPAVYLSVPYFQKWNAVNLAQMIDAGWITMEEAATGKAAAQAPPAEPLSVDALEAMQRGTNRNFAVTAEAPGAFAPGDRVRTLARPAPGHTRLPAYARAAEGRITAHHGAHLYADAGARGEHRGEHLYTVEFRADALWPDAEAPDDLVCLDLWEPYLEAL
jgi:nitrile hydratase